MRIRQVMLASLVAGTAGCTSIPMPMNIDQRIAEVRAVESAFAKTMADRDLTAFATFVAEDAVFINGGKPLRGKAEVLAHWKRYFEKPQAPFAWRPELVEVALTGDLGYSEGPVTAPDGKVFARFYSTWRRGADGSWSIVFDNGYPLPAGGQ